MVSKKPKIELTSEEKAERKAARKAENRRLKIEKKKQRARDVVLRELKFSGVTLGRHEKEWRQLLINITLPHMREELEFAWHHFELVIDNKDFTISLLMDEVKEAEEQYTMNCKNHVEHIDKLLDMFEERMEELKRDYDNQIGKLEKETEEDVTTLSATFTEKEEYLKTMLFMLEMAKKEQRANLQSEYLVKLEEEGIRNSQLITKLRGILEAVYFRIEKETDTFLASFKKKIKERKKEYEELRAKDDDLQELLTYQLDKIRKMYHRVKRLKLELSHSERLLGEKLKDLESEFDFFNNAFSMLKMQLKKDTQLDARKLDILTVSHKDTMQSLRKIKEKGEHILHVAAVCRKLETREEKICPFPTNYLRGEHSKDKEGESIEILDLFWQRVGQAEASRYAIVEERTFLRAENEMLQRKLHEFCQCLQCPVPQATENEQLNWPPYIGHMSKNVTEALLEMKKYKIQNLKF